MEDQSHDRPPAAPFVGSDVGSNFGSNGADWPVDVQRMDASGEVDLGQLAFNLRLTPRQRIEQNDAGVEFIQIARSAGRRLHAKQSPA